MHAQSSSEQLTELEGLVLALLHRDGVMTAYEIKESFRRSPSAFWSGSAGAVYPLVKRLEERGILSSRDVSETRRPRRVFELTDLGRELMKSWLTDVERASDPGYDPLRTRMQFMAMLDERDRSAFFDAVGKQIPNVEKPAPGEGVEALHKIWVDARIRWFRNFRKIFE